MRKASRARKPIFNIKTSHARWLVVAVATSALWTVTGCVITLMQAGSVRTFLQVWINYQGPFLIIIGTWLLLMIRSGSFNIRVARLIVKGPLKLGIIGNKLFRILFVGMIAVGVFVSGVRMGFHGQGVGLLFLWITFSCIEIATGIVTLHALEVLVVVGNLTRLDIKLSHYAPARTPELRSIVMYISTLTLLMTVGEVFGLIGSLRGHWTGPQKYIDAFRWVWPLVYFPICSIMLMYPQLVIHKLIQKKKEQIVSPYREELEKHLSKHDINTRIAHIEKTNHLADLVDRITGSPNYVIDFGIAVRTVFPLVLNLITLFVKTPVIKG